MGISNIELIRSMSNDQVNQEIIKIKRELLELRIQKATRQSIKPHLFKQAKLRLVHLLTVETQRNN